MNNATVDWNSVNQTFQIIGDDASFFINLKNPGAILSFGVPGTAIITLSIPSEFPYVQLGDCDGNFNDTSVTIDDKNKRVVVKGAIILRSPNDHYWRVTIDNDGNFLREDVGTELT